MNWDRMRVTACVLDQDFWTLSDNKIDNEEENNNKKMTKTDSYPFKR